MDSIKDSIKGFVDQATKFADEGVSSATTLVRSATDTAVETYNTAYASAEAVLGDAQVQISRGQDVARQYEEQALGYLQQGIDYAAQNPTATYAVIGGTAVVTFPFTRRLLYQATLGRFRREETTLKVAEERLGNVGSSVEGYAKDVEKLESNMVVAEEEMKKGMAKLKATRKEMQRLLSSVQRNEKLTAGILDDLRMLRGGENILQLRAEAATHKAALKQQRNLLSKYINRIVGQDI